MGEKKRAAISFTVTEKLISGRPSLLEKLKEDQQKAQDLPDQPKLTKQGSQIPEGENVDLKGVSQLVKETSVPGKGRFLIADKEIPVGANLIIEDPVASITLAKYAGTHCHHCQKRVEAPLACSTCCGVAFCSLKCKTEAKYHQFECLLLDLIIGEERGLIYLP